ncbi:MAG: T9SS type A sorting domain-containing protein, partial [Cyclobacteriaceae bacterium]
SISRNKKMPTSLLKRYSGAALWGKNNSKKALQGILYCLFDTITIHALEESNSLSISAYGQPMIVNSGTRYRTADGITSSYPGFTPNGNRWYYANYQNTVLIGGRTRHVQRSGAGLVDGIIGENIEFGTTNAGSALGNGEHERILYFIQPINNISNGYFIVSDLVKPTNTSDNIAINFQLNTMKGSTQQVVKNGEYYAPINGFVNDNHNGTEIVNLFFTSQPHIQIQESYKASKNNVIESDNLQANYSTNLNGELRANTIIFPEDKNHKKPFIQKINGENYDGALLKHNDKFIDVFLGTDGSIGNYGDVDFNAETVFFRKENNNISSYSITKGTHFFERKRHIGFSSSSDISITMEDNKGIVNTFSDTYVTFYKKNISEVFLDTVKPKLFSDLNNSIAPNTSELTETPKNAIRILIPKGRHSINITDIFGNEDGSIIHRIIPNPVKDGVFHLDFSDNFVSQKGELIITDIKGKLIKSKQLEETLFDRKRVFTVNVEGVEKGIYFIRLISTGGLMVYSDTFIIE